MVVSLEEDPQQSMAESPVRFLASPKFEVNSDYDILSPAGKGYHGHVRKAIGRSDGRSVIIKMIDKERLSSDSWMSDPVYGRVPTEIAILRRVGISVVFDGFFMGAHIFFSFLSWTT